MNKYLQSIIDDYRLNGGMYFQLPAGNHIVDEPLEIRAGETLDLRGCTLVVPVGAGPAVYLAGIGARVCSGRVQSNSDTRGKYGIIIHGSLTSVEDIELNGFDDGLIVESGHGGLIYPNPVDWVASDNCSLNRIRIWNCGRGVYAHGDDTNMLEGGNIYGQTVDCLIDSNTKSGALWRNCYHENGTGVAFRMRDAGSSVLDRCGSDGTPANFETSAGLVIMPGMPVTGPHQRVDAGGLSQLQAGDPSTLQGGVCDLASGMGPWVRSNADNQLAGMIPTDELRKRWPNWPEGWVALGTSDGRVSAAFAGPRSGATHPPLWAPHGILKGESDLDKTVLETVGAGPMAWPGNVGDFVRNKQPVPYFADGRLVITYGWIYTTTGWKKMIAEVADV